MKRIVLIASLFLASPAFSQFSALPHGITMSWCAPAVIGGVGTLQGFNVYRCLGTCSAAGPWTKLNATPVLGSTYIDLGGGLTPGNTYSYKVHASDSASVESNGSSNIFTTTYNPPATVGPTPFPNPPVSLGGNSQ